MFIKNKLNNFLVIKKENTKMIVMFNKFFFLRIFSYIGIYKIARLMFYINFFFLKKIIFIGKTFRFLIKNKKINFFFNRSHITILFFNNFFRIIKLKKNKFIIFFFNFLDIGILKKYIKNIRNLNIFTKRGLRSGKSFFFKKKGKISTYR